MNNKKEQAQKIMNFLTRWREKTNSGTHKNRRVSPDLIIASYLAGKSNMTNLSKMVGCSTASATGLANELIKKGLATRRHSKTDRRTIYFELTQSGIDLVEEIIN